MPIQTVRVGLKGEDPHGQELLRTLQDRGIHTITGIRRVRVYRLEGVDAIDASKLMSTGKLVDPIAEIGTLNEPLPNVAATVIEVGYRPGVMNPTAATIKRVARTLNVTNLIAATATTEWHINGNLPPEEIDAVV